MLKPNKCYYPDEHSELGRIVRLEYAQSGTDSLFSATRNRK